MEAKYYILKPAVNTPETGSAFPAADSYDDYDFKAPNSVHKLKYNEFPDFEPDIRFKLKHGAKLTDMLSQAAISAHGFLISTRLKEFFGQFNVVPHKFYPAKIEAKGVIHEYWWMHIVWGDEMKYIDYKNSIFFQKRGPRNLGTLNIDSEIEYKNTKERLGSRFIIGIEKLKLLKYPDFDLFIIPLKVQYLICDKLYHELHKKSLTGISYEEINWVS